MSAQATPAKAPPPPPAAPPRLLERYRKDIRPKLRERLKVGNDLALPRLQKITLSMGVGKAIENKKLLETATASLAQIAGQKAVVTKSKKSVAQWKVREGMAIGAKVTLRGARAYEFLDRLISVVIPRIRDFRGLPRKLDGRGGYSMGLAEQTVFPEIELDKLDTVQGLNITISISGGSDQASRALLEEFGFPFEREEVATRG
jgi:large subunit ribosomal protein L5